MRKLNVTFKDGKTIIDGIPKLLYLNKDGHGSGQLYNGGEMLRGLIEVGISAQTDTFLEIDLKCCAVCIKEDL